MNLKNLAAKPQLVKLTIDDEDIVKEYGEPLDFWTWDRQPIDSYLRLANGGEGSMMLEVVKNNVLDEEGKQVITDGMTLPGPVLVKVVNKIVETLGK
jgi:hypothetical protein